MKFSIRSRTDQGISEMSGIQSESVLPDDPTFSQINYNHDMPSFTCICAEFGIASSTDFHFKEGDNHGL